MIFNFQACALTALFVVGCTGDDGGSGGGTTFSCAREQLCFEYTGGATYIDSIRTSTMCVEQGGTEGTGCREGASGICMLPANASTGTSGAQYYYDVDPDFLMSSERSCVQGGGTWTTP